VEIEERIKSEITTYPWDVLEGKIIACNYVKLACQRFINFLHRDDLYFDVDAVKRVIDFCIKFKHFSGKHNGKNFELLPWQKFVACGAYGFKHKQDGTRLTHSVYISVARKSGKSSLVAVMFGLFGLIADGEYEAQVILSANSFQQAQILYKFCNLYLKSLGSKVDKLFQRYRDSIKFPSTESILKCVAADASKLDGFGPSIAILDELHEAPDSSMYDVMQSGQGARENPMIVAITTAGFNTFGFCANMERKNIEMLYGTRQDDSTFALIYTLDEGDDWTDENVWIKSNPNLGYTVKKEFIAEQIQKALNDPVAEIAVKTKNLNIWCDSSTSWIGSDYILSASKKVNLNDYQYSNAYIGLDLASVDDLSAVSVLIPNGDEFIFKNFAFVPEEMLKKSANKERYKRWIGRGELIVTPGNVTDYDYIINKIKEVCNVLSVVQIAYDSWNSTQAVIKMTEDGLPCMPYSQSIGSMNRPTKEMKRLFMSHKIVLDDNECTRFCFGNVVIKTDTNENEKATKLAYDNKIDICIAMIMALGSYLTTEHYDNIIIGTTN